MFRFTMKPSSGSHSHSWNYTFGSMWVHKPRTRRCQCYGCILWSVRRVCCAQHRTLFAVSSRPGTTKPPTQF